MEKIKFYFTYALRSLKRDQTRTILAVFCIAFGTLSIVAMQILANSIGSTINIEPQLVLGSDIRASNTQTSDGSLTDNDLIYFADLKKSGAIADLTLLSRNDYLLMQNKAGKVKYVTSTTGIDPAKYPFYGSFVLENNQKLSSAIATTGTAAITSDLAQSFELKVGDSFKIKDAYGTKLNTLTVGGVITATPDIMGDQILYSLDTAKLINTHDSILTTVAMKGDYIAIAKLLKATDSYYTNSPVEVIKGRVNVMDVFNYAFKGAGLLGLIVGGIGIMNTLQVVLARRLTEIATLKTVGYNRNQLLNIFLIETGLMGLAGSILGAGIAMLIADVFTRLLRASSPTLMTTQITPLAVGSGILAGIATALIFGAFTILKVIDYKPIEIFRENLKLKRSRIKSMLIFVLLALLFSAVSGFILDNALNGLIFTAGALVAAFVVSLLVKIVLKLLLLFPLPLPNLLRFPKYHLKNNVGRIVFPVIAMLAGITTITFVANVINSASLRVETKRPETAEFNYAIFASNKISDPIISRIDNHSFVKRRQQTVTLPTNLQGYGLEPTLESRPNNDFSVDTDNVNKFTKINSAYLPGFLDPTNNENGLSIGSTLSITLGNKAYPLEVAGFYNQKDAMRMDPNVSGILVSQEFMNQLPGKATYIYFGKADSNEQNKITQVISPLADTMVITQNDQDKAIMTMYNEFFNFVAAVASLALVAGAVLIANTVGLDLLERQKEIGILKALGYTKAQVLTQMLCEYSFIGLVAGSLGVAIAAGAVPLINHYQPAAKLGFNWTLGTGMVALSLLIAIITTLIVSWRSTSIRPLEVLRGE